MLTERQNPNTHNIDALYTPEIQRVINDEDKTVAYVQQVDEVIIGGGGAGNPALMQKLRELLEPTPVSFHLTSKGRTRLCALHVICLKC